MKRLFLLGLVCLLGAGEMAFVDAAPRGPSARAAARLKTRPTSRWLAHYLPDDRYKVAGKVWKYVSTDLDTYYHKPESQNMMIQPADRVIGFPSAKEAEDAGYLPGPSVREESRRLEEMRAAARRREAERLAAITRAQNSRTAMRAGTGRRATGRLRTTQDAMIELLTILGGIKDKKRENFPVVRPDLARLLTNVDSIPLTSNERQPMVTFKSGVRGLITAIDLEKQGKKLAAEEQATKAMRMISTSQNGFAQVRRERSRR